MRRMFSEKQIENLAKNKIEQVPSGTIVNVIGIDESGNIVKGTISSGTKIYVHMIPVKLG